MHPDDIYALTPLGESELHSSATSLTPAQLDLLVRFDGVLSYQQVVDGMQPEARKSAGAMLTALQMRNLVKLAEPDPFTAQWNADVQRLSRNVGDAEVDTSLASLQRSGFFVQIARPRAAPVRAADKPLTAIVVEDEAVLAKFTTTLLTLHGFQVRQAGDRAEVVAEIRRPPIPDLILLDVMLPDADGFDILLRVRQHPALKDVAVIMLTGKATRESVIRGISLGADGYVTKPCTPDALMRAVRTVLSLPQEDDPLSTTSAGRKKI
ncbi:response regulator transcription factor [Ramlibacter pallidus]|uniref:Response regulator n=1 Tax=Ramlibacter pallidus TaxID=2780087 RepID=A0ABR9S2G2_9BURK|nr:response regulator [Ramlibacter pallidus]MBE7367294.1 response regulator [Ramlibacter pallidus]